MPSFLKVITGCMGSGKTEELIRLAKDTYKYDNVLSFKSKKDTRSPAGQIKSRNGEAIFCYDIDFLSEIKPLVENFQCKIILIDEIHFFDKQDITPIKELVREGFIIYIGGLDLDYQLKPFKITGKLMSFANEVEKLFAHCECGKNAYYSKRISGGKDRFEVGGEESYKAVCLECYYKEEEEEVLLEDLPIGTMIRVDLYDCENPIKKNIFAVK